jgi:hypothetical protein
VYYDSWEGEGFDAFITEGGGDGFPSFAIVAFQYKEE